MKLRIWRQPHKLVGRIAVAPAESEVAHALSQPRDVVPVHGR